MTKAPGSPVEWLTILTRLLRAFRLQGPRGSRRQPRLWQLCDSRPLCWSPVARADPAGCTLGGVLGAMQCSTWDVDTAMVLTQAPSWT